MHHILLPLLLAFIQDPHAVTPVPHVECRARDARDNLTASPRSGYDFIPVTPDGSRGFFIVYSAKQNLSGTGIASTASIYVLPLANDEILIFGAGWGDSNWAGLALFDADHDVAYVTEIVRGCLRLEPALTGVHFVAPHGHPDHVNAAFLKALDRAGYPVREIAYHQGDRSWIEALPWLPQHQQVLRSFRGDACEEASLTYASPLGRIWFFSRPGHTAGAVDLVIDVDGNPEDRVLVRGSARGGSCLGPPGGTAFALEAHGTVMLATPRRGEVNVVEGRKINSLCLSAQARPKLGTLWSATIDSSNHEDAVLVTLVGTERRLDPGLVLRYGELLVDLQSNLVFTAQVLSTGGVDVIQFPIPFDPSLIGLSTYVQATILGNGAELCNALELVVGL